METDYTEKDILRELNRRFSVHMYSDRIYSLRTKNNWFIYYAENYNEVRVFVYSEDKSLIKEWFKNMLGKEMFYYTCLISSGRVPKKIFRFPSSFEELCIMNDLNGR